MGVMDRLTSEELGYLFDEAKVNTLMDRLINMVNMRIPSAIHVPPNDLGCALECFSLACGLVYAVFQFLQLQTDDSLLKRSSLKVLLRLNAEEEDADSTNSEESDWSCLFQYYRVVSKGRNGALFSIISMVCFL